MEMDLEVEQSHGSNLNDISSDSDSSATDETDMTVSELITKLEIAWQNEKLTVELLPPLTDEVDCIHEQITVMEQNLQLLAKGDDLLLPIHYLELNRIRYLLTSYLRTRLFKIQKYCWYFKSEDEKRRKQIQQHVHGNPKPARSRLLPKEYKFLVEYVNILEGHLNNVALQNMPVSNQHLDTTKLIQQPNLDSFIFLKCVQATNLYVADEELDIPMDENSVFMMRYRPVAPLVYSGGVRLI